MKSVMNHLILKNKSLVDSAALLKSLVDEKIINVIESAALLKSSVDERIIKCDTFDDWLGSLKNLHSSKCHYDALAYKRHNPKCKMCLVNLGGEEKWRTILGIRR